MFVDIFFFSPMMNDEWCASVSSCLLRWSDWEVSYNGNEKTRNERLDCDFEYLRCEIYNETSTREAKTLQDASTEATCPLPNHHARVFKEAKTLSPWLHRTSLSENAWLSKTVPHALATRTRKILCT